MSEGHEELNPEPFSWQSRALTTNHHLHFSSTLFFSCRLALVAAQMVRRPVHGLMLYGPAINYVYPYFERHLAQLPKDIRTRIMDGDVHLRTYGWEFQLLSNKMFLSYRNKEQGEKSFSKMKRASRSSELWVALAVWVGGFFNRNAILVYFFCPGILFSSC